MNVRDAGGRWIEIAEIGAAGLLIVSFLLPWFQARNSDAATSSWLYLLLNSGWMRALEADLITFGSLVALLAAIGGLVKLRDRLASVVAAIAVGGFAASLVGVAWTLTESGNAAFVWGPWGDDIDRGPGLLLFLAAALAGTALAVARVVLPASGAEDSPSGPSLSAPITAGARPPLLRYGSVRPTTVPAGEPVAGVAGRITVFESGRSSTLSVGEGERVIVGRDLGADIRVSDAKVSRRHAMIEWSAGSWIVRDLAAKDPTRLLDASGAGQILAGQIRIPSGQLVIGEVLITLHATGEP